MLNTINTPNVPNAPYVIVNNTVFINGGGSKHSFVLDTGEVIPGVSDEAAERLKMQEISLLEHPCERDSTINIVTELRLTEALRDHLTNVKELVRYFEEKSYRVLVVVPYPLLLAMSPSDPCADICISQVQGTPGTRPERDTPMSTRYFRRAPWWIREAQTQAG